MQQAQITRCFQVNKLVTFAGPVFVLLLGVGFVFTSSIVLGAIDVWHSDRQWPLHIYILLCLFFLAMFFSGAALVAYSFILFRECLFYDSVAIEGGLLKLYSKDILVAEFSLETSIVENREVTPMVCNFKLANEHKTVMFTTAYIRNGTELAHMLHAFLNNSSSDKEA